MDRAQVPLKKPYQKPKLRVYGDIRALTKSHVSTAKNLDGKSFLKMQFKTH
jgi:hypothetical protein